MRFLVIPNRRMMTFSPALLRTHTVRVLAIVLACMGSTSRATELDPFADPVQSENATVDIGLEQIHLPNNQAMGMLGTSYLVEVTPSILLGPAAYGSVSGSHGGFFTVGGELAWYYDLGLNASLQTGIYVGGGGGGTALVGGGLMIRPHADLMWDFGNYRAGISASNVRFPNGYINSNQIGLVIDFDTEFRHVDPGLSGTDLPLRERTGIGFDRFMLDVGTYSPDKSATFLDGAPLTQPIGYVGMRMERFVTPNIFVGIEANGAGSGGVAGYAEYLGNIGAETSVLDDYITLGTRVGLGMGGGGAVSVGGGALVKAGAYATANLTRNLHLSLEGGVVDSPNGNFRALYDSLALQWDLDHPYSANPTSSVVVNEWVAGTQHYFLAARKNGTAQSMDVLTLKLNRYVTDSLYLTGQANSAYSGQAGGFSVGLIGAGYRTPQIVSGLFAGAELLAGAAGGGGVDTSGGVVAQPMLYVGADINRAVAVRLSAGRIKALRGTLDSNLLELALSYTFGTTSRN